FFFFFQAEDGIRDYKVTGVQTCALPILISGPQGDKINSEIPLTIPAAVPMMAIRLGSRLIASIPGEMTVEMGRRVRAAVLGASRSEERRVGKECRARWSADHEKKKMKRK